MVLQNALDLPLPIPAASGGTGVASPTVGTVMVNNGSSPQVVTTLLDNQVLMGQNGTATPLTLTTSGGITSQVIGNNFVIQDTASNNWYTVTRATTYTLQSSFCYIANGAATLGVVFQPAFNQNSNNQSARIVGVGSGLFQITNPGGITMMIGNKVAQNSITSTSIGDSIEMITVSSTVYMFIVQQGTFTLS